MQNQAESEAGMPAVLNPVPKWFALVFFALIALQAVPGAGLAADEGSGDKRRNGPLITEIGAIIGYGSGAINEGSYTTLLIITHIGMDMNRLIPALRDSKGPCPSFWNRSSIRSLPHRRSMNLASASDSNTPIL